jgi:hypothetical protein
VPSRLAAGAFSFKETPTGSKNQSLKKVTSARKEADPFDRACLRLDAILE